MFLCLLNTCPEKLLVGILNNSYKHRISFGISTHTFAVEFVNSQNNFVVEKWFALSQLLVLMILSTGILVVEVRQTFEFISTMGTPTPNCLQPTLIHKMMRRHLITMTSQWVGCRLKSSASRLSTQPFIRAQIRKKHQSPASLAFVRGIHWGPVNSPHKWPVTRKMFPFDDVIMLFNTMYLTCGSGYGPYNGRGGSQQDATEWCNQGKNLGDLRCASR